MSWLADFLGQFLLLLGLLLVAAAFFAPFEALGWWSGWTERSLQPTRTDLREAVHAPVDASYFIVYLTGVLGFEGGSGAAKETALIREIAAGLPDDAVMISDVFPYSVSNNPLNGERIFAKLWRWIDARRKQQKSEVNAYNALIIARNVLQVAVSADPRYGPLSNAGVAREIARSLLRHGYPTNSGMPIYLIGYSGGGQISVGVARYLHVAFNASIRIVSLGGFYSDDPGIAYVARIDDLQGSRDPLPWVGTLLYPGRWRLLAYSAWNRARRAGKFHAIPSGPMAHFGDADYFSRESTLPDGEIYANRTAALAVAAILDD
ncbi:MAG: hypothetical protein H6644_02880 [Caldilineaceae bacterium]|nr:hypothetical protein [Caldilineaceae bacterium]